MKGLDDNYRLVSRKLKKKLRSIYSRGILVYFISVWPEERQQDYYFQRNTLHNTILYDL